MEIILANHLSNWKDFTRQFTGNLKPGLKDVLYYHFFSLQKIALDKLLLRLHKMYEAIGQATQTTIDPILKDQKIETVMGKLERMLIYKSHQFDSNVCKFTEQLLSKLNAFLPLFCTQLHNITILWKVLLCVNFKYFAAF